MEKVKNNTKHKTTNDLGRADAVVILPPKVLVACEYSGRVREAFAAAGCDAWSCDILPSEKPGNHYEGDVKDILYKDWDALIAFPPCTYLTITANRSFVNNPERWEKRLEAMKFVYDLMNAPIKHIAIENPVGAISTWIRKPEQYIQPYQFGDAVSKKTGLWLKGLPLLQPTNIVEPEYVEYKSKTKKQGFSRYSKYWSDNKLRDKRDRTFEGVAAAMAEQWTPILQESVAV